MECIEVIEERFIYLGYAHACTLRYKISAYASKKVMNFKCFQIRNKAEVLKGNVTVIW